MTHLLSLFAAACDRPNFLSFPTWYAYLPRKVVDGQCTPIVDNISDVWLIVAAVISILLRIAALLAVFFVIYGGIQLTTSQGNPDATSKARTTIINALVGLLLAITAAALVQFVAGRFN
jgi:ABC-type Fe3+ transport system permease subunit